MTNAKDIVDALREFAWKLDQLKAAVGNVSLKPAPNVMYLRAAADLIERLSTPPSNTTFTEVHPPFARVPTCVCDTGHGEPPSKAQRLECRIEGGPCAREYGYQTGVCSEPATLSTPPSELGEEERFANEVWA